MNTMKIVATIVHVLLLIVLILAILTGYGITDYHIVESITFGALTKALAFQLHTTIIIPLILLIALHIFLVAWKKYRK